MNHHLLNSFKTQRKNMEIPSFSHGDTLAAAVRAAEKR
ncbi:hypothetical protein SAMD00020551_3923 [Mesobacillus selenatarsenatis SF-1]|uniref:Uncharacterized protein n=1 Tax=Mesobacillus selenatarsenatis (strain DSM 18680 / JCM 14380 / FERM P-15431 / SF-1) TaxID=1321606 RepID=A0A0A8X716_MESS1|nr:hypothetical protein SAMD00020551_3923 [Mesobacillus selenatarsenatis SF-1]